MANTRWPCYHTESQGRKISKEQRVCFWTMRELGHLLCWQHTTIFLLDTILQNRQGSGKNWLTSHVKERESDVGILELEDLNGTWSLMCVSLLYRCNMPPHLDETNLRQKVKHLKVTWCLCLSQIANVIYSLYRVSAISGLHKCVDLICNVLTSSL